MLTRRAEVVPGIALHSATSRSVREGVVTAVSYEISVALCKLCAKLQNQQLCWQHRAAEPQPNRFLACQIRAARAARLADRLL